MNDHEKLAENQQDPTASHPIPAKYSSSDLGLSGETTHGTATQAIALPSQDVCNLGYLKQQIRKREYLQIKKSKLQERSNIVLRKVHAVKFRRETESNMLRESISLKLDLAQRRREAFLESRRQSARKFTRNSMLYSYCGVNDESSDECDSQDDLLSLKSDSDYEEAGTSFEDCKLLASALCLQKHFKRRILHHELDSHRRSNLFRSLLYRSVDNLQAILSKGSSTSKKFSKLFWLLDMPGEYSVFLYSFILMVEFRDTVKYGSHPGYNTNLNSESKLKFPDSSSKDDVSNDKVAQVLALVLFKCASVMVNAFNNLIILDEATDPISLERLRFARLWRKYYSVFETFRQQHLERTLITSREVIRILREEEESSKDDAGLLLTIVRQRKWLALEALQLKKHTEKRPHHDWSVIHKNDDHFLDQVSKMVDDVGKVDDLWGLDLSASQDTLERLSRGYSMFSPKMNTELYPTMHYVEFGKLHYSIYRFPPYLTPNEWRKYLIRNKCRLLSSKEVEEVKFPRTLKTGYYTSESNQKKRFIETDIEEALSFLKRPTIMERVGVELENLTLKNESFNFSQLDECLSTLFLYMFEYCVQFNNLLSGREYESIVSILASVRSFNNRYPLMRIKGRRVLSDLFHLQFRAFQQLTNLLPRKLQFANQMAKQFMTTIENFKDDTEFSDDFMTEVLLFYQDAEIKTQNMWFDACACSFKSAEDIRRFECLMVFSGSYYHLVYSSLKSTSTPQLRFPKFYDFLSVYDRNFGCDILPNLDAIYQSSLTIPDFFKVTFDYGKLYNYFRHIFLTYLTLGTLGGVRTFNSTSDSNELTNFFYEDFLSLQEQFREIWLLSVIWTALHSGFGAVVIKNRLSFLQHLQLVKTDVKQQVSTLLKNGELVERVCENVVEYFESDMNLKSVPDLQFGLMKGYLKSITMGSGRKVSKTILWKLLRIVRCNAIGEEHSRGTFRDSFEMLEKFHRSFQDLFGEFYSTYKPLLEWIYSDIGQPEYDLQYCEEVYKR